MPPALTRILSDIHYADSGSWVDRLNLLEPLCEGVERMIVNGDALDTQVTHGAAELADELRGFFRSRVRENVFVTGNHDPDISDLHELALAEGRVWVTHGDVFYDDIAPWSRRAAEIRRRVRQHAARASSDDFRQLETRFEILRAACRNLPIDHDPNRRGRGARTRRLLAVLSRPDLVLKMLHVWRTHPGLALKVAAAQRPEADVVINGHTHRPGVWERHPGKVVINTGSFCPPAGGQLVDVAGDQVTVRRVERVSGEFRIGEPLAEFRLAERGVSAITART